MVVTITHRLYLRRFLPEDAADLFCLNNDSEVLMYTGDRPFESMTDAFDFLRGYKYTEEGLGRWAVIDRWNNQFLGWCGIRQHSDQKMHDLGFRLYKRYWNQGFATEAAKACIQVAFEKFQLPELVGRANRANHASIRVLEKCGFQFVRFFDFDGHEGVWYELRNPMA